MRRVERVAHVGISNDRAYGGIHWLVSRTELKTERDSSLERNRTHKHGARVFAQVINDAQRRGKKAVGKRPTSKRGGEE